MTDKKAIVVWFSCGAASAVAAKLTLDKYGESHIVRVVNNPVIEEHPDNKRFLEDVQAWLGVKIEYAINQKYPSCSARDVWEKRKYMSGIYGAPCTGELKIKARQIWESENKCDFIVMGYTVEEKDRHDNFILEQRDNLLPVLIEAGFTKQDCYDFLKHAGVRPPAIYDLGFPNANCIGCVKATNPTYWNLVREKFPSVFADRAEQSRRIGSKLAEVKKERVYLDELDPNARGRDLKSMDFECGLFCPSELLKGKNND